VLEARLKSSGYNAGIEAGKSSAISTEIVKQIYYCQQIVMNKKDIS